MWTFILAQVKSRASFSKISIKGLMIIIRKNPSERQREMCSQEQVGRSLIGLYKPIVTFHWPTQVTKKNNKRLVKPRQLSDTVLLLPYNTHSKTFILKAMVVGCYLSIPKMLVGFLKICMAYNDINNFTYDLKLHLALRLSPRQFNYHNLYSAKLALH